MTPREALLSRRESVAAGLSAGRIAACAAVSCPPAVPIAVMGERITPEAARLLTECGVSQVEAVIE